MKHTIHRGAHEVGGNCVEVIHGKTRLVLDLGLPLFDKDRQAADTFRYRQMTVEALGDEGLMPEVAGLFDPDADAVSDPVSDSLVDRPDAILLSHAHLDHTGLVDFSHPDIPIFATRGTSKMMLAGKLFARQAELPRERFRQLNPGQPVTIGEITITAYGVDHSIHGAVGFLLEADGQSLFYSGDLRMHGLNHLEMSRLVFDLRKKRIDTLLVEGTHFGLPTSDPRPELQVASDIDRLVAESDSLVLACLSPQHTDRLLAFYRAAIASGRTFCIDLYTAFVMQLVHSETDLPRPAIEHDVRVFLPKSVTKGGRLKRFAKLINAYGEDAIPVSEIIAEPDRYVCIFRESMLDLDFGGELPERTLCLYGRWMGYLEEASWKPVQRALDAAGGRLEVVHSTGHLLEEDICRFVRAVNPKTIVPIHTFEPGRVAALADDLVSDITVAKKAV
ncbi:Beta-lactamase superfamily domain protein [Planctomycetes bacterium MalM25]|nr:Beta-lactamase superfamily domain protein [Planctomycetes bacterium MalM25]